MSGEEATFFYVYNKMGCYKVGESFRMMRYVDLWYNLLNLCGYGYDMVFFDSLVYIRADTKCTDRQSTQKGRAKVHRRTETKYTEG